MVSNFDRKMVVTYWDNIFKLKKDRNSSKHKPINVKRSINLSILSHVINIPKKKNFAYWDEEKKHTTTVVWNRKERKNSSKATTTT